MTTPSEDYRLIDLTQNQFTKVSLHRYEELTQWKWCASWCPDTKSFYVERGEWRNGKIFHVRMNRYILGLEFGNPEIADHINHDTLDNRDSNLRTATQSQSAWNRRKKSSNTSGYIGLDFYKRHNKWGARITVSRKRIFLGMFPPTEEGRIAAARAYDAAATEHFGEFAHLNFPTHPPQP